MGRLDAESETLIPAFGGVFDVAHTLKGDGFDASEDGTGRGTPIIPIAYGWQNSASQGDSASADVCPTLDKSKTPAIGVRRLTPVECERLQGFPDGYTDIRPRGKPTPDGPRYKALGNSMAVPCMRWIGERVAMVDVIQAKREAA
jgi:DNA (cytosine-5)-methyltransferase 1